jgi:hypothetical protein
MNVNIWGPALWDILHGFSSIVNENNFTHFINIIYELNYLLPCIHCQKSYIEYYNEPFQPPTYFSSKIYFMKYVYDLHNKVNEKLDTQKGRQSINPDFYVILKRLAINNALEEPFQINNLWKFLFTLALKYDTESNQEEYLKHFIRFISSCSNFLNGFLDNKISNNLDKLKNLIYKNANVLLTGKKSVLFVLICKTTNLNKNDLYNAFVKNVPAGSCGTYTCI